MSCLQLLKLQLTTTRSIDTSQEKITSTGHHPPTEFQKRYVGHTLCTATTTMIRTCDLPANDEERAEEHGDVHRDDEHKPLNVARHVRRHVTVEPPQLCNRTLYTHGL